MPLRGRKRHIARLRKLSGGEIVEVIGQAVFVGADVVRAYAHQSIVAGSQSGKGHVPSAPGEAPNNDTGTLVSHLKTARTGKLTAEVRSEAGHSTALELGTSKMAARPFLRPARDATRAQVRDDVVKKLNRFLRKHRPR